MAGPAAVMSPVSIEPMRRGDVPPVARLEQVIYPQPWSKQVFYDELGLENRRYVVARDGGDVVGYAGLLLVDDDAHITTVAVDPGARGRRVGTRLMLALAGLAREAGARHLTLEVRVSNRTAQVLYGRFGFSAVGVRKNYYRDEDALIMWAVDIDTPEYGDLIEGIRKELG